MELLQDYADVEEPPIPSKIDIPKTAAAPKRKSFSDATPTPLIAAAKTNPPESQQKSKSSRPEASKSTEKPPPIPFGWQEKKSSSGATFYFNPLTKIVTWSRPHVCLLDKVPSKHPAWACIDCNDCNIIEEPQMSTEKSESALRESLAIDLEESPPKRRKLTDNEVTETLTSAKEVHIPVSRKIQTDQSTTKAQDAHLPDIDLMDNNAYSEESRARFAEKLPSKPSERPQAVQVPDVVLVDSDAHVAHKSDEQSIPAFKSLTGPEAGNGPARGEDDVDLMLLISHSDSAISQPPSPIELFEDDDVQILGQTDAPPPPRDAAASPPPSSAVTIHDIPSFEDSEEESYKKEKKFVQNSSDSEDMMALDDVQPEAPPGPQAELSPWVDSFLDSVKRSVSANTIKPPVPALSSPRKSLSPIKVEPSATAIPSSATRSTIFAPPKLALKPPAVLNTPQVLREPQVLTAPTATATVPAKPLPPASRWKVDGKDLLLNDPDKVTEVIRNMGLKLPLSVLNEVCQTHTLPEPAFRTRAVRAEKPSGPIVWTEVEVSLGSYSCSALDRSGQEGRHKAALKLLMQFYPEAKTYGELLDLHNNKKFTGRNINLAFLAGGKSGSSNTRKGVSKKPEIREPAIVVDDGPVDDAPAPEAIIDRGIRKGAYRSNHYSSLVSTINDAKEGRSRSESPSREYQDRTPPRERSDRRRENDGTRKDRYFHDRGGGDRGRDRDEDRDRDKKNDSYDKDPKKRSRRQD